MTTWSGRAKVYAVVADLIDVSPFGRPPGTEHVHGRVTIRARGEGIDLELPHHANDIAIGDVIEYQIRTKGDTYMPPPTPVDNPSPIVHVPETRHRRWWHR